MLSLLLIPLTTALACWLVFKLFITIPFRPAKPIKILGFTLQGILPAKQSQLAGQLGRLVSERFFSIKTIEQKITDPKNLEKIMPVIDEHIDDFLRNKLKKQMPVISMFIGDKTITSLKEVFIKELENLFPQIMSRMAANLTNEFNIGELVAQKISDLSLTTVEEEFKQKFSKQLRMAAICSITIGLLIGLLTALTVYLLLL